MRLAQPSAHHCALIIILTIGGSDRAGHRLRVQRPREHHDASKEDIRNGCGLVGPVVGAATHLGIGGKL